MSLRFAKTTSSHIFGVMPRRLVSKLFQGILQTFPFWMFAYSQRLLHTSSCFHPRIRECSLQILVPQWYLLVDLPASIARLLLHLEVRAGADRLHRYSEYGLRSSPRWLETSDLDYVHFRRMWCGFSFTVNALPGFRKVRFIVISSVLFCFLVFRILLLPFRLSSWM